MKNFMGVGQTVNEKVTETKDCGLYANMLI